MAKVSDKQVKLFIPLCLDSLPFAVIDRIQLLISTLTTTGLGAIPLNTPSTATLPELAKRIEKCTGIAYERRVELRDSSRGIVEVLAGGGHIRRGA